MHLRPSGSVQSSSIAIPSNQFAVRHRFAISAKNAPSLRIETHHFENDQLHMIGRRQNAPQRRRDISGRKRSRRDLIQQRLKQMVIVRIDHRKVHLRRIGDASALLASRRTRPRPPQHGRHRRMIARRSRLYGLLVYATSMRQGRYWPMPARRSKPETGHTRTCRPSGQRCMCMPAPLGIEPLGIILRFKLSRSRATRP